MVKKLKNKSVFFLVLLTVLAVLSGGTFAVENNKITWMSYGDFIDNENDKAWVDPSCYVGYTAQFNTINYDSFTIGNVADGKLTVYEEEVSLNEVRASERNLGLDYRVIIKDYYVDTAKNNLWYKVEAAEGYSLPEEFADNPYVLYLSNYDVNGFCAAPRLIILPKMAMVNGDSLTVNKDMASASSSPYITLNTSDIPDFFEVYYVQGEDGNYSWYGYDIGDISLWDNSLSNEYRYVEETAIILIPPEVTVAYEGLMNAEGSEEYNEYYESIPDNIKSMFTDTHLKNLEEHTEELVRLENIKYEETIDFNGIDLSITVKGKIPENGHKLSVSVIDDQTVLDEGFDIDNVDEIVAALDIKIVNVETGKEWQPEEGNTLELTIDMASLGYEDGKVFRLHHKHGDTIYTKDVFVVMNGKLTIHTSGFSAYIVQNTTSTSTAQHAGDNGDTLTLEVGKENATIYYNTITSDPGVWSVEDTAGAIYYEVHDTSDGPNNGTKRAPWIEIVPLKETNGNNVILTYKYYSNGRTITETYNLEIISPKAEDGKKKLYIKDDVNNSGRIIATLVDDKGNEITDGLVGASFAWERTDEMFITPRAYGDGNRSINIAVDHSGLVEARKKDGKFTFVTYKLDVILSDGTELDAEYTVYYQSEIINASFESPDAKPSDYTYFVNGAPGLYWKTTAPGPNSNLTKDIEYANFENGECATGFGVDRSADWKTGGVQFAELNAEDFGALYQDIISAPGEDIDWNFSHAPRRDQSWATNISNAMFIVIGATEDAQKLTKQSQLEELGAAAKAKANELNITNYDKGLESVEVEYNGAKYVVWYHEAGTIGQRENTNVYSENNNYGWTDLKGSYNVPADSEQYRTRIFFVSEKKQNSTNQNAGNLIDVASAGQYKEYLIEYYEETFVDNHKVTKHISTYDQKGQALVYSNVELKGLEKVILNEKDYLHRIMINNENYPYEIRFERDENGDGIKEEHRSIYIEKYPGKAEHVSDKDGTVIDDNVNDYSQYDIVVQIFVRDSVIAIQKELDFPDTLTEEQKLKIIDDLNASSDKGYKTSFLIDTKDKYYRSDVEILITGRSPDGRYVGYVSPDDDPDLGHAYYVREKDQSNIPGLQLSKVTIGVTRYRYGEKDFEPEETQYTNINLQTDGNKELDSVLFMLSNDTYKIAEVEVINEYVEKNTTIHYKAVGNGKVAFVGDDDLEYVDTPSETLAYYSGKAVGAKAHPGSGATFVGWFKDPECTISVKPVDGVYNESEKSFKPNANILNADEVTFYAKFVSGTLSIKRTEGTPGQIFVYRVQRTAQDDLPELDFYVSVTADKNGNVYKEINEISEGTYTVTEVSSFSWRYGSDKTTITKSDPTTRVPVVKYEFEFSGKKTNSYWVNGFSEIVKNIYEKLTGGGT